MAKPTTKPDALTISIKVSEKGALSFYGLGSRFPVTLYRAQIEAILARKDAIEAFIAQHAKELAEPKGASAVTGATVL